MKKLFLDLTFAALCAALLAACGGDSGSSADSLDESSSSSEMDGTESSDSVNPSSSDQVTLSSDSEDLNPSGSEGGKSSGSVEGTSSDSSEGNSSGSSEEPDSDSSEGDSSSSEGDEIDNGSVYDADANTLTDLRDGHVYRTTTIDIPVKDYSEVWMAENLNYKTANSYCYGDDPDKCNIYGRLYKWSAAVGRSEEECGYYHECNLPVGNIRGACPEGWHLPSEGEFELLVIAVDGSLIQYLGPNDAGTKLKSVEGWNNSGNGTDIYSFSALPAGHSGFDGKYVNEGDHTYFWSSTQDGSYAYRMYLENDIANLYRDSKFYGFSVRCLMD